MDCLEKANTNRRSFPSALGMVNAQVQCLHTHTSQKLYVKSSYIPLRWHVASRQQTYSIFKKLWSPLICKETPTGVSSVSTLDYTPSMKKWYIICFPSFSSTVLKMHLWLMYRQYHSWTQQDQTEESYIST